MYLNCHSYHSLRYGTIPLLELVQLAHDHGVKALALTDINTVTGIYDFVKACKAQDIKPVVGMEFREQHQLHYIALAKNKEGLAEICRWRTEHNLQQIELPKHWQANEHVIVIYPIENAPDELAPNEFIGIRLHQLTQLHQKKWAAQRAKMVILQPVTYRNKKEFNLHKILRAIDLNVILSRLTPNDYCHTSEVMQPLEALYQAAQYHPDLIAQSEALLNQCYFDFEFKSPKNKKHYTNSKYSDRLLLRNLAFEGFKKRYKPNNKEAYQRVLKELDVIDNLDFSGYFLITWDIIRYSNSRGFMHVGRGSGANSIVSYCLGITDICPIELNLYFERFLNPSRTSPPDFDIDWSWQNRDDILDYIFKRFDTKHVAFCGTIVEFKYRSIFRELGKVFGLAKEELDVLAKQPMAQQGSGRLLKVIQEYGTMLEKYPNMRSMHSCGILISEEPITNYTALEMPPKGFPIVQFDMHIAEDIGFEKFDILSQRGIGHINDAMELIEKNQGIKVDVRNVQLVKDEARCNEYLRKGKTLGCFYIESPAMRGLLRKLQCSNYITLVAASSIIRPGVAQSGMMTEYVFRHNNPDKFEFFHPVFEEQLGDTYGVMVYQEDVIKIAHHFAGLDLADADILRRAMSGKTRSRKEFDALKQRFFDNCKERGYPDELSLEVYRQIESFAGYSFCKAHSASYAVESYQSLYLKAYYPIEFMVAVINNFGGFYRTEVYVHEARMAGANICNPCINKSDYLSNVDGRNVYLGFVHLKSVEESLVHSFIAEREQNGLFTSLDDFIRRVPIGIETLQTLIFIGAFRFTQLSKNELILQARMVLANYNPEYSGAVLIHEPVKSFQLPVLDHSALDDVYDEIELLGFPVSCSPFDLLQTKHRGEVMQCDLLQHAKKVVRMIGYLVSIKHVPTKRGTMNFGTWFDVQGNHFDTAHFSDSLQRYPFQGGGCYLIQGKVQCEFDFPTVIVEKMAKLPFVPDPRYHDQQDMSQKVYQHMREDISSTQRKPYPTEQEIGLPRHRMKAKKEL
jgi:DNA polymerase-3 subunit alpha/error-prone DNA polymerase